MSPPRRRSFAGHPLCCAEGQFQVDATATWEPVDGVATTTTASDPLTVYEARSHTWSPARPSESQASAVATAGRRTVKATRT